jgi:nitric oxide reductase large subunit
MCIAVASPGAVAVFMAVTKGMEVGEAPVVQLVEDLLTRRWLRLWSAVVFAAGRAAYRLAEAAKRAGLYEKIRNWPV